MTHWTTGRKIAVAAGAAAVVFCVFESRRRNRAHNDSPVVLDPDLSEDTRQVVLIALVKETNPALLRMLADKLGAAGYHTSEKVVRGRADLLTSMVARGIHATGFQDYLGRRFGSPVPVELVGLNLMPPASLSSPSPFAVEPFHSLTTNETGDWTERQMGAWDMDHDLVGLDGPDVRSAQLALRKLGWNVEVDGALGPRTVLAIKQFQSLHDLDIDGILGPATIAAILSAGRSAP